MAVSRRLRGMQKILIFLRIYILCCGLFHNKSNITTNFSTWHELYVCSEVVKVEISTCDFQRRKKIRRKPLGSLLKLVLGCRILLYALYSLFLIYLSGDVELNPGPRNTTNQISCDKRSVKCLLLNARSLMSSVKTNDGKTVSNLERFQNLVYCKDIDIVFVNETWLSKSVYNTEILHAGYTLIRNDREGRGGGVLLGIKTGLFKSVREIKHNYNLEIALIELTTMSDMNVLVGSCYRPPNADKTWIENFDNLLNDVCTRH